MVKVVRLMNPFACLRAKKIPPRLQKRVDAMEAAMRAAHPLEDDTAIAARVQAALKTFLTEREDAMLGAALRQIAIDAEIYPAGTVGVPSKGRAKRTFRRLMALFEGDMRRRDVDVTSVARQWDAARAVLHRYMGEAIQRASRRVFTPGMSREKGLMRQFEQEMFGEPTGNKTAADFAKSFREMDEFYVNYMNSKHVPIKAAPQGQFLVEHSAARVSRADVVEWSNFVLDRLDHAKMINRETGAPLTRDELQLLLPRIYQSIVTHGTSELDPRMGPDLNLPLWRRLDQSHFFIWKNHSAWSEYNQRFGYDDTFQALMKNLDSRARNMALVTVLGPDPEGMTNYLKGVAAKLGADAKILGEDPVLAVQKAYDQVSGETGKPGRVWLADAGAGTRKVVHSAILGQLTPLSFLSDNITAAHARLLAGISTGMQMPRMFANLLNLAARGPKSEVVERALIEGIGLQSIVHSILGSMRGMGEMDGWRWAHYMADTNYRITGQTIVTDAIQEAYGLDWNRTLVKNLGKSFDQFHHPYFADTLKLYGVTEEMWQRFSAGAQFQTVGNKTLLDLTTMARSNYDDTARIIGMIEHESQTQAVLQAQPETRRHLQQGTRPGTVSGEAIRAATDLLNWPVTFTVSKLMTPFLNDYARTPTRMTFYAGMAVALTLAGALIAQSRQITNGRDPYAWNDPKLWVQGLTLGGGLGIMGDLIFREFYGSNDMFLAGHMGPTFALFSQIAAVPYNAFRAALGEPYNFGRDAIAIARDVTPFSSAWFAKVVIDRLFFDTLQRWFDPKAYDLFRARERAPLTERGQQHWWAPGTGAPQRAPALAG